MENILIIDDSSSIRSFIRLMLEDANYNVVEAENGAIGIEKFRAGNFDLVITDIYMPVKSGLQVVVTLKKEYPKIDIIVLSDGGKDHFSDYMGVCEALGATYFLSKAQIKSDLLQLIKSIIEVKYL